MTIKKLEKELKKIYKKIVQQDPAARSISSEVHETFRLSAKNLYRYMILRSFDLRKLHDNLSDLGISSIRTAEGYVYSNLFNVIKLLRLLQGKTWIDEPEVETIGYKRSMKLLRKHANELFGRNRKKHFTEIMVTLPDEAADDITLIRNLVAEGMEIARINLSHGDVDLWKKMIANINQVKKETNKRVKIFMDLSGPKMRTSAIQIHTKKGKINEYVKLNVGDHLVLTKKDTKGRESLHDENNDLIHAAEIGVLLPQIIDDIKVGDTLYFDDGMIKAVVIDKNPDDAILEIIKAYKSKLSSNKGINLPNTMLNLPSLTERDIELLPFVCQYADIVGYSFVRKPEDVIHLYNELDKNKNNDIGVVLKIEKQEAFENQPLILFEAMKRNKIGVMIARGDLAVEIGFERISEVQNEILWLCEAAHVPVIWATQVLENLAKTGVATRAEVSDASMSVQAECVMLNKGPFIVDAVRTLKDITLKMAAHSSKKKSSLRALKVAKNALLKMDKTKMAVDLFDKYADRYQEKYMDVSLYHDTFDLFCDDIKKENAEILELGCGPGNITRYLLEKRPGIKLLGTDLSKRMITLAKINNPAAEFELMDCRDFRRTGKKYDGIMGGFCLPYLSKEDSIKLIQDAFASLNPDGVLYLSTMEDDYDKSGLKGPSSGEPDQLFIHYHEAGYLTEALTVNGFAILELSRKEYSGPDGAPVTDLVIIAQK